MEYPLCNAGVLYILTGTRFRKKKASQSYMNQKRRRTSHGSATIMMALLVKKPHAVIKRIPID